jgi:hypothetical protein
MFRFIPGRKLLGQDPLGGSALGISFGSLPSLHTPCYLLTSRMARSIKDSAH